MVGGGGAVHGGSVVGGEENGRRRQFVGTRDDSFEVEGEEVTMEVMVASAWLRGAGYGGAVRRPADGQELD